MFAQHSEARGGILRATLGLHFCFNFQWFLFESFMAARYNALLSILAWLLVFVWAVKLSCNSMKFHHNFCGKVIFLTVVIWFPQLCIVLVFAVICQLQHGATGTSVSYCFE